MKLLILDDDAQIREGIQFGIDWKDLGFDEVRSAGDGLAGMKIAREMAPDLVLSDVRMPGMDGMEFLLQIKILFPGIKVLLISGYDDFEYLKKAVKYNADDYELKPIKVKALIKRVVELRQKIEEEQEERKRLESYRTVYEDTFLTRILENTVNQNELIIFLKEKLMPYGYGISGLLCNVIDIDPPPPPLILTSDDVNSVKKRLGEFQKRNYLSCVNSAQFLLISGLELSKACAEVRQKGLMKQFSLLNQQLKDDNLSVSVSISRMYPLSGLRDAYNEAIKFLRHRSILGRGTIICIDTFKEEKETEDRKSMIHYSDVIFKMLINQDETELRDIFSDFRERLKIWKVSFSSLERWILHSAEKINHYLLAINIDENCFDIMELQKEIDRFTFLEDLLSWWEELLYKTMLPVKKARVHARSRRIVKAIDYIQAHLFEDISTDIIAEVINITPNYFSAQFKKEIGISFKAYITRERLDVAAYLLTFTDEPIYIIAEKIGYHDYIYFSHVFKQTFGSSPSDYRSRTQAEKNHKTNSVFYNL